MKSKRNKRKRTCVAAFAALGSIGLFTVKDVAARVLPVALIASAAITVSDKLGWLKKDDNKGDSPDVDVNA